MHAAAVAGPVVERATTQGVVGWQAAGLTRRIVISDMFGCEVCVPHLVGWWLLLCGEVEPAVPLRQVPYESLPPAVVLLPMVVHHTQYGPDALAAQDRHWCAPTESCPHSCLSLILLVFRSALSFAQMLIMAVHGSFASVCSDWGTLKAATVTNATHFNETALAAAWATYAVLKVLSARPRAFVRPLRFRSTATNLESITRVLRSRSSSGDCT